MNALGPQGMPPGEAAGPGVTINAERIAAQAAMPQTQEMAQVQEQAVEASKEIADTLAAPAQVEAPKVDLPPEPNAVALEASEEAWEKGDALQRLDAVAQDTPDPLGMKEPTTTMTRISPAGPPVNMTVPRSDTPPVSRRDIVLPPDAHF